MEKENRWEERKDTQKEERRLKEEEGSETEKEAVVHGRDKDSFVVSSDTLGLLNKNRRPSSLRPYLVIP